MQISHRISSQGAAGRSAAAAARGAAVCAAACSGGGAAAAAAPAAPGVSPLAAQLEPRPGEVVYFAYGSNMAPATLTGRRRVRPRVSAPAAAPALRLSFGMLGFPFTEPAFATLVPPGHPLAAGGAAAPPAHGVLHVISRAAWDSVCRSEGVGSSAAGYQAVQVECRPYRGGYGEADPAGGGVVRAVTLQGADASLHSSARVALPSARYLSLLREGAAHHGLEPSYQSYLAALEAYAPAPGPPGPPLGALASAGALLAAAGPALPLVVAARLLGGGGGGNGGSTGSSASSASGDDWVAAAAAEVGAVAMQATWAAHDALLAGVLGSGCRNGKP